MRSRRLDFFITRFTLALAASFLLGVSASSGLEWPTTTIEMTPLLDSTSGEVIAEIPAGADILAQCFGTICFATWDGREGYFQATSGMMTMVDDEPVSLLDAFDIMQANLRLKGQRPSNDVAAWGDSLTLGQNVGDGNDYPSQAEKLFGVGVDVANLGVGGQTSTQIATRSGAPLLVTVLNETIPAQGDARIVTKSVNLLMSGGKNQGAMEGSICGVNGTMSTDSGGNWTFMRETQGGTASPCAGEQEFEIAEARNMRPRITWFWMGRNMADNGHEVVIDIGHAIKSLGHDRFLVGGLFAGRGGKSAFYNELNAALKARYGSRFVDIFAILTETGGDGSEEDKSDIANGFIPRSLFQGDGVHLTATGYAAVAQGFYDATIANNLLSPEL